MKWVRTLLGMAVFIFVIFFSLQNREEVILHFGLYPVQNVLWEIPKMPLFLVILCSIFLGVLIGSVGDLYSHFQLKKTIRQNRKMIEKLERQIQSLSGPVLNKPSFLKEDF